MRPNLIFLSSLVAGGVSAFACQPVQDENVNKKLDEISKKLDTIEKKIGTGGPARPTPPPGPDPNTVYSVPVEGSAISGPKTAKITVVEAFEFA